MFETITDAKLREALEWQVYTKLSGDYPWTEESLEEYKNLLDWKEVVWNGHIRWNVRMLEHFEDRIPWDTLSASEQAQSALTPGTIRHFAPRWNWRRLSSNTFLTLETVEEFADRLDWEEVINNVGLQDDFGEVFYNRFQQYIPARGRPLSLLWEVMTDEALYRKEKELNRRRNDQ